MVGEGGEGGWVGREMRGDRSRSRVVHVAHCAMSYVGTVGYVL